ncbi:hypothetical protein MATL_G00153770 [Megalops atlanticus]|uniref:Uncharacterized protein n=1 Tax=Megalops atlanticus TaxID=7932 RepID=A0A9D3PT90_MEGAT|nr:hypothetical protein MATL_G00153770 [Megalops atlanticus]
MVSVTLPVADDAGNTARCFRQGHRSLERAGPAEPPLHPGLQPDDAQGRRPEAGAVAGRAERHAADVRARPARHHRRPPRGAGGDAPAHHRHHHQTRGSQGRGLLPLHVRHPAGGHAGGADLPDRHSDSERGGEQDGAERDAGHPVLPVRPAPEGAAGAVEEGVGAGPGGRRGLVRPAGGPGDRGAAAGPRGAQPHAGGVPAAHLGRAAGRRGLLHLRVPLPLRGQQERRGLPHHLRSAPTPDDLQDDAAGGDRGQLHGAGAAPSGDRLERGGGQPHARPARDHVHRAGRRGHPGGQHPDHAGCAAQGQVRQVPGAPPRPGGAHLHLHEHQVGDSPGHPHLSDQRCHAAPRLHVHLPVQVRAAQGQLICSEEAAGSENLSFTWPR